MISDSLIGTVTGQRIVSTEVTNQHHVQLLPAGLDSSDVFIQVVLMMMLINMVIMVATIQVVLVMVVWIME